MFRLKGKSLAHAECIASVCIYGISNAEAELLRAVVSWLADLREISFLAACKLLSTCLSQEGAGVAEGTHRLYL